jgi:hypothetical protein
MGIRNFASNKTSFIYLAKYFIFTQQLSRKNEDRSIWNFKLKAYLRTYFFPIGRKA